MLGIETIENLLFIDIETASANKKYKELSPILQKQWARKATRLYSATTEKDFETSYYEYAGIYAEFAKVVCVSCGYIKYQDGTPHPKFKSFYGEDEKAILQDLEQLLARYFPERTTHPIRRLCGHNIKEFDVPFLARRFVINGLMPLPRPLQMAGKKPWENPHIDTMEQWKFGDYKAYTSLELLAEVLGVQSPKTDMDGSQVSTVFWQDKDCEKIKEYCESDVLATMQVTLKLNGLRQIETNK